MKHRRRGRRVRRGAGKEAEAEKDARRAERVGEGPYSVRMY